MKSQSFSLWRRFWPLVLVLVLAAGLRLAGVTWGVPTPAMPIFGHPDETRVMDALASIDLGKGAFTPQSGHLDGMLDYYLWTGFLGVANSIKAIDGYPHGTKLAEPRYQRMLVTGRVMVIIFDLASIILVYLILLRLHCQPMFAGLGGLVLAIVPIEMIYAHYMRTHVVTNFFVTLAIYCSLFLQESLRLRWRAFTGFVCGMAMASMYSGILVLAVPFCMIAYEELVAKRKWSLSPMAVIEAFANRSTVVVLLACALGLFVCDPMLFLGFREALGPLTSQWEAAANFNQLGGGAAAQFHKIATYLSVLLPWGIGPYLWIPLYVSFFAALGIRRPRQFVVALNVFILAVVYLMGMAYFQRAEFVRTMIMIVPPLSIVFGLVCDALWKRLNRISARLVLTATLVFFLGSTLVFDVAYVRGMMLPGAREAIFDYFGSIPGTRPVRVGVMITSWMTETMVSPLRILESNGKIDLTFIFPDTPSSVVATQDYVCFVDFMVDDMTIIQPKLNMLLSHGEFRLDHVFETPFNVGFISFNDKELPHDMAYPFPKILVLRALKS